MSRLLVVSGGFFGFLSVATGAFGAHALRGVLEPAALSTWETGSRYAAIHAVVVLLLGLQGPALRPLHRSAGWLFVAGMVLFSGSLWGLALTGWAALGPVTPLGGLSLLSGWLLVMVGALRGPAAGA